MKKIIKLYFKEDEVDSFLKNKFGYGIWEFELSILQTYMTFFLRDGLKVGRIADKRAKQIEKMKEKIIETIDDFLTEIDAYKYLKKYYYPQLGISKWTPKLKKSFIAERYYLYPAFHIMDSQINKYLNIDASLEIHAVNMGTDSIIYIKPINFLVLIWSHALKQRKNIDWINMNNLMHWFSKRIKEKALVEFLGFREEWDQTAETLRSARNKYKHSEYNEKALHIYSNFFEKADEEYKKKYPQMVATMKKRYVGDKIVSVKNWAIYNDIDAFLSPLVTDISSPEKSKEE